MHEALGDSVLQFKKVNRRVINMDDKNWKNKWKNKLFMLKTGRFQHKTTRLRITLH